MNRIYLDYNATTPLHPEVKEEIIKSLDIFGNPSSMHSFGREASERIEKSRKRCADLIGASSREIIFTGGGSESNNTVLKLVGCGEACCCGYFGCRNEVVTSTIEHPSVLETVKTLGNRGVPVHFVRVDSYGKIDMDHLRSVVGEKTALVSIMYANNEIGTIQDIKAITALAHERGALMHTDAVQAVGKLPVDVADLEVDFLSFSGHKLYAPKGVGVLYTRTGSPYCSLIHGGHQEGGRRAGTLNNLGIIALGKACELTGREMTEEVRRLEYLRNKLRDGIEKTISDIRVNGHPTDLLPGTLNVSFYGVEGEAILLYLDMVGISVSTGSACATGSLEPSHVILATGTDSELAHGSIRFSMGFGTTEEEIDRVIRELKPIIERLRKMSTVYGKNRELQGVCAK